MRRIICLLITGLFLGQLLAFEQVYAAGRAVIKSGSEDDYPPFCVVAQDGKADGFSVELLRAALSAVNLDVEFKTGKWDPLKKALSEGTIQVLPLVGRTPERETVFDFTFPYLTLHGAVFVRKGDTRIKQVSDLSDKAVVVMRGDNAEEFARRTNISSNIVAVDTYAQAMHLLEAGKYDAVIAQRLMGIYLLDKIKIKKVVPLDFDLKDLRQDFCFAVRDGDRDLLSTLNEGLSIVIANGTFDRLHKKWFGPLLQEQITFKDVVKYVLIVFALTIISMTLILIVILRREVKRKTRSLVQEIAERKQAEEGLIESEKRLKREQALSNAIIDSIPGTFYMLDESGRYARWNSYQRDEIVGKPDDLMTATNAADTIHPDDRVLIGDRISNVLGKGIVETVEGRVLLRGGPAFRWLLMTGRQMKIDGRPFLVGIGIDITDSKRAEESLRENEKYYRSLVEGMPGIVYTFSKKRGGVYYSSNVTSLLGYSPEQLYAQPQLWHNSIHPDDQLYIEQIIRETAIGKPFCVEYRIRDVHGNWRWFEDRSFGFKVDGEDTIIDGLAFDITDRKQAEEEKAKLEAQLFQSQKMEAIGTLAGGIAHDFNNILSVIIGYTELARDRNQKENKEKYLQEALNGSQRAKNLVKQILTFSRHGDQTEKKPLDIKILLKEAIKFLRSSIPTTVEINQQITDEECTIMADPTQMHQVIMNLCTNASHAMKETGGTLKIELTTSELGKGDIPNYPDLQPGHYVKLTVSDTGYGIDPAIVQRIFDPFFTTKSVDEGTGLGLSVVYGIVKGHGGVINVYSEQGKGAAFNVYLPMITNSETMKEDINKPVIGGTERILFVDDEPGLVDIGTHTLSSLGYNVTGVLSSAEALNMVIAEPQCFDLIITDMTLPKMTGIDLSRKLLQIRPDIPIILCSGIKEPNTEEQAKSLGIKAYLTKPLTKRELSLVIRDVLDGKDKKEKG